MLVRAVVVVSLPIFLGLVVDVVMEYKSSSKPVSSSGSRLVVTLSVSYAHLYDDHADAKCIHSLSSNLLLAHFNAVLLDLFSSKFSLTFTHTRWYSQHTLSYTVQEQSVNWNQVLIIQ